MKRKNPYERLMCEIDLAILENTSSLKIALLHNSGINSEFYLGYTVALRFVAARAADIYENSSKHTDELFTKLKDEL